MACAYLPTLALKLLWIFGAIFYTMRSNALVKLTFLNIYFQLAKRKEKRDEAQKELEKAEDAGKFFSLITSLLWQYLKKHHLNVWK